KKILCKRIDDGNYPEIKIIEPDGMLIRKQQILELQQEFSMAAVEGNKRIYVIKDADKMRSETANSMLKFLEEPDNDIIAILMTNNFNNLLSTIISRCQVIRLNNDLEVNNIDQDNLIVLNFIKCLENEGINTIMKEQELLFNTISTKERDKYIIFFDKMIDMYYDILKIFEGNKNIKFSTYYDELKGIADKNTKDNVLNKIDLLVKLKDRIRYNVNINLLIDTLIVNIGGKYENSWS
ncbi:MAG: hypothetical protein IKI04_00980, partial [Bacilli bacterium]|nr:hypothetical protein [Bacilli bacterium]